MSDTQKYGRTSNLFDKSTAAISDLYGSNVEDRPIYQTDTVRSIVLQCEPNTTYTLQKILSNRFIIWTTTDYPATGDSWNTLISTEATNTVMTFTTGESDHYLIFMVSYDSSEPSSQDILDSIMYNYGSTALPYQPYYGWVHSLSKLTSDGWQTAAVKEYTGTDWQ